MISYKAYVRNFFPAGIFDGSINSIVFVDRIPFLSPCANLPHSLFKACAHVLPCGPLMRSPIDSLRPLSSYICMTFDCWNTCCAKRYCADCCLKCVPDT